MDLPSTGKLMVGTKQVTRAISEDKALKIYIANDADEQIRTALINAVRQGEIPHEFVESKSELGRACGIKVGSACAAIVKD